MKTDIIKYLEDILLSIEAIELHLKETTELKEYQNNLTVIDAVERRLSIIGEALYKVNKLNPILLITDKSKIVSLRHILIHEYDLIEDATIWNIVHKNLPVLKREILESVKKIS